MKWASLLVCALGGALVLLTGCDTLAIMGDASLAGAALANVRFVDGSPQTTAVALAAVLKGRGFQAAASGTGDEWVVESKTSGGLRFALVLNHAPSENGHERTRVALEWMDNGKDDQTHVQIMAEVDKQPGAKK